ncbi:MAG: NAD-dependent epimerase/dehydratase family protein [Chloroflexota bacterium]|nr:NAD-dependent epimerase/dehydratase family protein [Chloroflexota bacterium]
MIPTGNANGKTEQEMTDQVISAAPVLVTGAAGYIGSILVRRLLHRGYHVRVLDRLMYGDDAIRDVLSHPRLEMVVADFRDRMVAARAVQGVSAVIHLGAIVGDPACAIDEDFTIGTNFEATRILADAARRAGVGRFVFGSTCSVYGASAEMLDETSALNPVSLYANTKIAAERALLDLRDADFAPVIMRFATAYGHSYRPRYDLAVNVMTAKAVTDGQITIHGGDQWRPFVHVDDIARALVLALEAPVATVAGETFNVGSDEQNHQLKEVGEIIQRLIPHAAVLTNDLVTDKRNYYVQFTKIRETLGFTPAHTLVESIFEMKEALDTGEVLDYQDRRYNNHQFLSQIVSEVARQRRPFATSAIAITSTMTQLMSAACDD